MRRGHGEKEKEEMATILNPSVRKSKLRSRLKFVRANLAKDAVKKIEAGMKR